MSVLILPDGVNTIAAELEPVIQLIARTARWVHPDVFHELPVWYPETARGMPDYNADWTEVYMNKSKSTGESTPKKEMNIKARKALWAALGLASSDKTKNWTVCHIWGFDDPRFKTQSTIVKNPRYYSCVGNMVLLPTPLKGFTDSVPEIKNILRTCAYYLYGWVCDAEEVAQESGAIKSGIIPAYYPEDWPATDKAVMPSGIGKGLDVVGPAITRRKQHLKNWLAKLGDHYFPSEQVRSVLQYWRIRL